MPSYKNRKAKIAGRRQVRDEHIRKQRHWKILIAIAAVVIVLGVIGSLYLYNNVIVENQVIATIGNTPITNHDLEVQVRYQRYSLINQYIQYYQYYTAVGQDPTTQTEITQLTSLLNDKLTLGGQVLDKMIDDIIIKQQAQALGITVTSQDVDQAMQTAFSFFPNGTPTATITPTIWLTPTLNPTELSMVTPFPTLTGTPAGIPTPTETPSPTGSPTPTSTPYTQAGYQNAIQTVVAGAMAHGVPGFSEAELRSIIETQVYRLKVQESVTKDINPDLDQVWVRHVVLADQASAASALTRLKGGEGWISVALAVSTDTATKNGGGDMGWFPKGVKDPALEKAAFSLPVGQVSDPIQTQAGWEIIQVIGHEVRPVDDATLQQLKSNAFQTWLTDERTKLTVTKNNNWSDRIPVDPTLDPADLVVPTQVQ